MNLLFLNSIEVGTYGGMEDWIRLVASGLSQRGHNVTVSGRKNSEFLKRVSAGNTKLRIEELDISGDFNPFTVTAIKKYIDANSIDTVVVNFNKDLRLGGMAARWVGNVRVVWSLGLDITKDNLIHKMLSPKLFDGVIVPSHSLKEQVIASGYVRSEDVRVIPIGIPSVGRTSHREQTRESLGLPKDCTLAVTSGRFVDQKGHRFLIEAAVQIVKVIPNMRFLFLGDGPLQQQHEQLINKLGLQNYFHFAGMLKTVHEALAACDLMIHPSIEEPFGIVLLEAMRARLPIVASRVGGIPEVVSENESAYLVPPQDAAALAESVISLVSDVTKMEQFAATGYDRWNQLFRDDCMIDTVEGYLVGIGNAEKKIG